MFLYWDIETLPMLSHHWSAKTDYIPHDFNEQTTTIACAAWKYSGNKTIHSVQINPRQPRNDKKVIVELHKVLMDCGENNHILVHQNGDRFDLPKIEARCIYYGLKPLPKLIVIDTLKQARKFGFDYFRLDFLDKHLSGKGKVETRGWLMWRDIVSQHSNLKTRTKALKEMVHYCKGDISALERVFNKLRPYMKQFPNMNFWQGTTDSCPNCGSDNTIFRSQPKFSATRAYRRKSCNDCHKWFQESKSIKDYNLQVQVK